jgi:hypothetical protein
MHLERSYQQLTLVDDAGKKHNLCELLANLCPEVTCHADSNAKTKRSKASGKGTKKAGGKSRKKADPKGSSGGGQGDGQGNEKPSTSGADKGSAKAGKGQVGTT